jgi:hypothetical protein
MAKAHTFAIIYSLAIHQFCLGKQVTLCYDKRGFLTSRLLVNNQSMWKKVNLWQLRK